MRLVAAANLRPQPPARYAWQRRARPTPRPPACARRPPQIAINDSGGVKQAAHLLKYDSTLGTFGADVKIVDDSHISVNGKSIKVITMLGSRAPRLWAPTTGTARPARALWGASEREAQVVRARGLGDWEARASQLCGQVSPQISALAPTARPPPGNCRPTRRAIPSPPYPAPPARRWCPAATPRPCPGVRWALTW